MNIEEVIKELKSEVNDSKECRYIDLVGDECVEFFQLIETLPTAYEKEKEEHKKECHNCDEYTARLGELETENKMLKSELEKEKEKNKNKDKILRNIREKFLKYDWKNANPIQTYNQIKSLYESIYCKPYEE